MSSTNTFDTREAWLQRGAVLITHTVFAAAGIEVPVVKTSCSWPGGGSARKRIGECWARRMSEAGANEIFISPVIADPVQALDVLTHELVHASDDCASGHGGEFVRRARKVGLEGKPTATVAGAALRAKLVEIADALGPYPHATLNLSGRKKQTTRMIKVECGDCDGVFRTTQKWLDEATHGLCCPFCHGDNVQVGG